MERGWSHSTGHGVGNAIDRPSIESFLGGIVLGKGHVDRFIRRLAARTGFGETQVVPMTRNRLDPLSLALLPGIFDHDAHAVAAVIVVEISEDPDARMIHLDDSGDSLRCAQPQ